MICFRSLTIAVIGICLLFASFTGSFATTYYVKPSGNDNLSGTSEATAWQHVVRAGTTMVAGDTVLIMDGSYNEQTPGSCDPGPWACGAIRPTNSGTEGNPIVFKAYPGHRPIIGGDYDRMAVNLGSRSYVIIESLEVTQSRQGVSIYGADHIEVNYCKIHHTISGLCGNNTGGIAIMFEPESRFISVKACSIYHNWEVCDGDTVGGGSCAGIKAYRTKNSIFEENVIWDQPGGIDIKWLDTTIVIRRNIVHDCGVGISPGDGGHNCDVYENIVYNCGNAGMTVRSSAGGFSDVRMWNNVIYECDNAGMKLYPFEDTPDFQSWNNIIMNCHRQNSHEEWTTEANNHPDLWSDYNCFCDPANPQVVFWNGSNYYTLSQYQSATGLDQHSIQEDPLFVNPPYDFHLLPGSPCRGTGQGGVDMGAYPSSDTTTQNESPQIDSIQCEKDANWVGCSEIAYGDIITRVRANVTDSDGTVDSVRFRLENLPDNHEFFNGLGSSAGGSWYVLNNNDLLIQDGGDFRLTVIATDDDAGQTSADSTWSVPWGTLSASLINPTQDSSVYQNQEFSFQAQVVCLGGECGNIEATLDPTLRLDETTGLEDTYININYDQNADLDILSTYTWPQNMVANAILMKWDISSLAGLNIEDARLYLYLYDAGGDNPYTLTLHKIINYNPVISTANGYTYDGVNGWTPNNQCYNNIPLAQADIGPAVDVININLNLGYKSFDVTALIQDWQANPETNYGLLINSDPLATYDSYRLFYSQERANVSQRPYMIVTYSGGSSKGAISTSIGATPFYTTSINPQTEVNMKAGDVFYQAWEVVPTGGIGEIYEFFVINHPTTYSTYINDVESPHINITITQPNVPAPPQAIGDLMATISGDSVLLTWSAVTTDTSGEETSIHHYVIYRGTKAYFDPTPSDSIGYTDSNTLSFVDLGIGGVDVVGDVDTNYYYVVEAVDIYGNHSDVSNRTGEYDYEIVVTSTTDFSYITLPFTGTGITDADGLISSIGASNISNVSRFIQSSQSYETRFAAGYGINFSVVPGGIYQVIAKNDTIWSIAGTIPHADSISYSIDTTFTTDFNFISIPFEDEDIYQTAQDVIDSLPGALNTLNNFIPSTQSWESRFAAGYGPNFAVKPGGVYQANVKASATFPPGE